MRGVVDAFGMYRPQYLEHYILRSMLISVWRKINFIKCYQYLYPPKVSGHPVFAQNSIKSCQANCEHKLDASLTSMHYAEHYHIWQ
jgi:hypothetical protein